MKVTAAHETASSRLINLIHQIENATAKLHYAINVCATRPCVVLGKHAAGEMRRVKRARRNAAGNTRQVKRGGKNVSDKTVHDELIYVN